MKLDKAKLIAIASTYYRAGLAAVGYAFTVQNVTDPKGLAEAFAYGAVGPILAALNKNYKAYGRGSKK